MSKVTDLEEALVFLVNIRKELWEGDMTDTAWYVYHSLAGVASRISRTLQALYLQRGDEEKAQRLHMNEPECIEMFSKEYEARLKNV